VQPEDQFLEDVLKIFHNSKGSVINTIIKRQNSEQSEMNDNNEHLHAEWKPYPEVPFKHASGQYESLSGKMANSKHNDCRNKPHFKLEQVSKTAIPSSIIEKQPEN